MLLDKGNFEKNIIHPLHHQIVVKSPNRSRAALVSAQKLKDHRINMMIWRKPSQTLQAKTGSATGKKT